MDSLVILAHREQVALADTPVHQVSVDIPVHQVIADILV